MNKTIMVFGANGMLGRYITRYFETTTNFHVVQVNRDVCDATKVTHDDLINLLHTYYNHDHDHIVVVNCIGIIPQRNSISDIRSYIKVNTLFPHLLWQCCSETNNKLIHISTDCVYSGSKGNYIESDQHDEQNIYGLSKSLGEPSNDATVIRTSIIGEELQNKRSLLEWARSNDGKTIDGYTNHYWNGVTCLQLAKIIHHMINSNIFWKGVRHIYSPKSMSKYELVRAISNAFKFKINVNPIQVTYTDKTLSSSYDLIAVIPDLEEQLADLVKFSSNLYSR